MKIPRHLSHLYQSGGRNSAPVVNLTGAEIPKSASPVGTFAALPIPPPIRTGPGPQYLPPPARPIGIVTR